MVTVHLPAYLHAYIHMYVCTYTCTCVHTNLARVLSCISSQYCQGYDSIVWDLVGIIELTLEGGRDVL